MVGDEIRISIEANPYYAWHAKGKTPIKRKKLEIHKSKVIFGALSLKKGRVISHICDRGNGENAVCLLEKLKRFKHRHYGKNNSKLLLLWDNVSSHKSKEVKEWLSNNPGEIELDNFPPYSPELNPIEHVWKELRQKAINRMRGEATLSEIIKKAKKFLRYNTFNYKLFGMDRFRIFK